MTTRRTLSVALMASVALTACSTVSKVNPFHGHENPNKEVGTRADTRANRIPVVSLNEQLKVSDTLRGQDFFIPLPAPMTSWPVPGGTLEQSVENVAAAPDFKVAWRKSIGVSSTRRRHVTSPPIAAGGRIFAMDGVATVSAHDAKTGATLWRRNIMPKSRRNHEGWGGGLAWADGKIYASSGFREVVQLDAQTGQIGWRTLTEAPVHSAPTVSGGRVYVSDVNDELLSFNTADGNQVWTYQALTEPARMLAASSPAVSGETVVTSFASGELVAVQAANGSELWNTSLSRTSRTNALSEIRDIAGRPVIYQTDVFAISHADVMAAVDFRTGSPRWTIPLSGITSPWAAGDVVYAVDLSGRVACISRESGQVYWIHELDPDSSVKKPKKRQRLYWSSPVLASNRLIVADNFGDAVALDPKKGTVIEKLKLGSDDLIGPIAVDGMVYFVTDKAELVAIR
ncbi:MAG TPA: PQQ-binding-like beta-propeller repeat protein [Caulobacteraceae bacterium]|jgi:outer membrane protein assembly factor BamB